MPHLVQARGCPSRLMKNTFATIAYFPYPLKRGGNCIWGTPPDSRHPDLSGCPSGLPFFSILLVVHWAVMAL